MIQYLCQHVLTLWGRKKTCTFIDSQLRMFPKIGVIIPKWMVYNGKPYEQMDDLGVFPYFWKHPYERMKNHHRISGQSAESASHLQCQMVRFFSGDPWECQFHSSSTHGNQWKKRGTVGFTREFWAKFHRKYGH